MKEDLINFISGVVSISLIIIGMQYMTDGYPFTYKPKHKVGEFYEYWYKGNEFKAPELAKVGSINKVGKDNYLIVSYYCNLRIEGYEQVDVIDFKWFDKDYKVVSKEQLILDTKRECDKKK